MTGRNGSTVGLDKIPMESEFKKALEGNTDLDEKIIMLNELNNLA